MAKKFDTNPLDSEFPERVDTERVDTERVEELETQTLNATHTKPRGFADPIDNEKKTRKLETDDFVGFSPEINHASGQPMPLNPEEPAKNRKHTIGSITLPENILLAAPYIPFAYIGLIAGIIELVFIPRNEPRVRYHAAQGVAAHLGIFIVTMILGFAGLGSDLADVASTIFGIVTTIILIIFAFKAWQGKPIHIETVETLTDWLEEKISPQK